VSGRSIPSLPSPAKSLEDTARRLYAQSVQVASRNIWNPDCVAVVLRDYHETRVRPRIEMAVRSQQQIVRHIPEVQLWLSQYDHVTDRYKVLLLDGPSLVGAIRYTGFLTSPAQALCLDCAGAVISYLRKWQPGTYEIILFNEVYVRTVLMCKKLFQASLQGFPTRTYPRNNFL